MQLSLAGRTVLHELNHLIDGDVPLVFSTSSFLQECIQLIVAKKGILSTNIVQDTVEVIDMEGLVVGFFDLLDDVLAKARWYFV